MNTYLRCALSIITCAAGLSLSAPTATALPPGCDWNTDEGTQACMGGSSFDAGTDGDTYGPSGAAGFLYDTRLVLQTARAMNDTQLLGLGQFICDKRREGMSEDVVKQGIAGVFANKGFDPSEAGYMVIDAEMYLCPDY